MAPSPAALQSGPPASHWQRRDGHGASGYSAPKEHHHTTLRRLLGLPRRAPIATILAEAGQPPLHITWLVRAARFWNSLLDAPAGSVTHAVVEAGLQMAADSAGLTPAQLPWLAQLICPHCRSNS